MIKEEQLIAAEEHLLEAIKYHQLVQLDKLLHDDLIAHAPNGEIFTKGMDLEAHQIGSMVVDSIMYRERIIQITGDAAVVSVIMEAKGKMVDQQIDGDYRYLRIWKKFDNELKVIAASCIKLKEKEDR